MQALRTASRILDPKKGSGPEDSKGWVKSYPQFSRSAGGPFLFSLRDLVPFRNPEGSFNYEVYLAVIDPTSGEELGQIQSEISENQIGPMRSSAAYTLAALDRLGFESDDEIHESSRRFAEEEDSGVFPIKHRPTPKSIPQSLHPVWKAAIDTLLLQEDYDPFAPDSEWMPALYSVYKNLLRKYAPEMPESDYFTGGQPVPADHAAKIAAKIMEGLSCRA